MGEKRVTEVKVGLLIIGATTLFLLTIMSLGGSTSFFVDTYNLKIKLENVEGIGPGSVVQLLGIPIGNVKSVHFSEKNEIITTIEIEEAYKNVITEDSEVKIKTQGALGDKFVHIKPGQSKVVLQENEFLQADNKGDFLSTLSSKGDDLQNFFDVIHELKVVFQNFNKNGRSDRLSHNLAEASLNLNKLLDQISRGDNINKSFSHLANILEKIDNGNGTLGALINDPSIHQKIKSFLGGESRNKYLKSAIRQSIKHGHDTSESK